MRGDFHGLEFREELSSHLRLEISPSKYPNTCAATAHINQYLTVREVPHVAGMCLWWVHMDLAYA